MRKIIIFAVLVIGMVMSAQAQVEEVQLKELQPKSEQVFAIDNPIRIDDVIIMKTNVKGGIKVIKVTTKQVGRDKFQTFTLETGSKLVFKNGDLIGGIK